MSPLTRAEAAFAQDIRGGAPKALGKVLSRRFCGKDPLDFSSGDTPKCLGPGGFPTIDQAMRSVDAEHMAYDHPLYAAAQEAAWRYMTGLPWNASERDRTQIISGVSTFMPAALRVAAHALGYPQEKWNEASPIIVLVPPTHPHWLASTTELFGGSEIRTIRRTPNGLPDMEDAERVFRSLDRPFILILSPDENPAGVCTPNHMLINPEETGLINRVVNHSRWGVVLLDSIYMDTAWGSEAGKRHDLIRSASEIGARMLVMHSLSKIFRKPGIRIGAASYTGPLERPAESIGLELLSRLKAIAQGNIMNGISSVALAGLIEAYSGKNEIEQEITATIELIRGRVAVNGSILNSGLIGPAYPDAIIEAGFYGLHRIRLDGQVPYSDPEYHQGMITHIERSLDMTDLTNRMMWRTLRHQFGIFGMSASHAFTIRLAMKGLQVLGFDPFFPMFKGGDFSVRILPDLVMNSAGCEDLVFRTILAYPEEITRQAKAIIENVYIEDVASYRSGQWRTSL